jgi:hypothetical protein
MIAKFLGVPLQLEGYHIEEPLTPEQTDEALARRFRFEEVPDGLRIERTWQEQWRVCKIQAWSGFGASWLVTVLAILVDFRIQTFVVAFCLSCVALVGYPLLMHVMVPRWGGLEWIAASNAFIIRRRLLGMTRERIYNNASFIVRTQRDFRSLSSSLILDPAETFSLPFPLLDSLANREETQRLAAILSERTGWPVKLQ